MKWIRVLELLLANEAGESWAFETLDQITISINVGWEIEEEEEEEEELSTLEEVRESVENGAERLLPGPSFVSVMTLLTLIAYRRKLNL